ncbi:NAD-dependent epimerase/dehydratase family protein [Streptomyces angustmyceticus]|uniref:NAD-dependent epimerase/dehydratase family protein n=1 Tax=Streptomyces angustmyceticus TaxID=285578 RepID=UPI003D93B190
MARCPTPAADRDPDGPPHRVVVLGAGGFIGRQVAAAVRAAGGEPLLVARRPLADATVRCLPLDLIGDGPDALSRLLDTERPSAVVNAAGAVWSREPETMRQANHTLVETVLAALAAATWRPRLVHLGSVFEYAPPPPGTALDERAPTRPTTPYGQSKLQGTRAVLAASADGRADAVVLRLSNVIGAGTSPSSLLGQVAAQLRAAEAGREAVVRVSPLRASRDFVDVRDTADAVLAALTRPVGGQVINIGRGEAVPVRTMVERLIAAGGRPARIVEGAGAGVRTGTGLDWMQVATGTARRLLGWSARHSLDSSAQELWRAATARPAPVTGPPPAQQH